MTTTLTKGDPVEAHQIMIFGCPAEWVGGYVFAYYETDASRPPILTGTRPTCIVEIADGALAGAPVRYDVECVRRAEK